jgi:hypothetical protein
MAKKTADEIIQMFVNQREINFGSTSGCHWSMSNGSEACSIWLSRKQTDWVLGVYDPHWNIDSADGTIYTDGKETRWLLRQTSRRSNNGAGLLKLAR